MFKIIPDSLIEEIKYANSIENVVSSYVALNKKGRNYLGLCPFHSEKTPSFTVYPETSSYYCFGCGAGGDAITFIRERENLSYTEAVKFLADRAGIRIPEDAGEDKTGRLRTKILEINRETARYFYNCLVSDTGKKALAYLLSRGMDKKTIKSFGVGYAPDSWDRLRGHLKGKGYSYEEMEAAAVIVKGKSGSFYDMFRDRIMFPIIDLRGNVIGFGGRIMEGKGPKYLNSPDTMVFKKSRNLFALNFAKKEKAEALILGEGYMDVIAMHQAGFKNAVATLGTSLTEEQARLIAEYAGKVIIAYDSDEAGQKASKRALNIFSKTSVSVSVLEMKGVKDPDEFIKKYGAVRFANLIDNSKGAVDYEVEKIKNKYDLDIPEEKIRLVREFCAYIAGINNDIMRDVYIGKIAKEIDFSKETVISNVESIRKKKFNSEKKASGHNLATFSQLKAHNDKNVENPILAGYNAEQELIAILHKYPDYYKSISGKITKEDFFDKMHKKIFTGLTGRITGGESTDITFFSKLLESNEISRFANIIAKYSSLSYYPDNLHECIKKIHLQKDIKNNEEIGEMSEQEYQNYIASLVAKKK